MTDNEIVQDSILCSSKNIVIFGEAGVGKSSLINLIAGRPIAATSSEAKGCTFHHQKYDIQIDDGRYTIWDTAGLDEGSGGTVPAKVARSNLERFLRELIQANGIHLLIYCVRASRLRRTLLTNYNLFYSDVCRKKVPIAVVVTNLENYEGAMEHWWDANEGEFATFKMHFDGHACVTTLVPDDDDSPVIKKRCEDSRRTVLSMIATTCAQGHWGVKEENWISAALTSAKPAFKPARKDSSRPILTVAIYDLHDPPLHPIGTSKDKSPFEGLLVDVAGTPVFKCRVRDLQLLAGHRFQKEIVSRGADLLIFCASARIGAKECSERIAAFYGSYGGDTRPLLVVARDAATDAAASQWWLGVQSASPHRRFHAIVRAMPPLEGGRAQVDVAVGEIQRVILTRSLEPVGASSTGCFAWLLGRKPKLPSGESGMFDPEDSLTKTGIWVPLDA